MNCTNIEISRMTLDDFESIKEVLISEFDSFWTIDTLEVELKDKNSYYLVGKIDSEIVCFAGIKVVLDEADIMNVVTRKGYRNLGIGSIIFEKLILFAKKIGVKKLMLEVNINNIPAIHLYEKFNFEKIAIRKKYYNNIDDAIIMNLIF